MPLDPTNPQQMAQARAVSTNIINAHGIPDLTARRQNFLANHRAVESAHRSAEFTVDAARRKAGEVTALLRQREDEVLVQVANETTEAGKKRYANETERNAAKIDTLKKDEEYLAIKAQLAVEEHAIAQASMAAAEAKADYNAMLREHQMMAAEHYLAAARINALASIDVPVPAPSLAHAG